MDIPVAVNLPGEIWKPVVRFEGLYCVSNLGRVKSCNRLINGPHGKRKWRERIITPQLTGLDKARLVVWLWKDNRSKICGVGRLVLEAFVGPCPMGMECCHDPDPTPTNCCLTNVRWDTKKANCQDKRKHGTYHIGEKHMSAKLTNEKVRLIRRRRATGEVLRSIASDMVVSISTIKDVTKGNSWTHIQ